MSARTELQKALSTNEGMTRYLDDLLGVGNYVYDPTADVWVAPDESYEGPGRGFIVMERGGFFSRAVLPDSVLS
jgi:hypothetical protein